MEKVHQCSRYYILREKETNAPYRKSIKLTKFKKIAYQQTEQENFGVKFLPNSILSDSAFYTLDIKESDYAFKVEIFHLFRTSVFSCYILVVSSSDTSLNECNDKDNKRAYFDASLEARKVAGIRDSMVEISATSVHKVLETSDFNAKSATKFINDIASNEIRSSDSLLSNNMLEFKYQYFLADNSGFIYLEKERSNDKETQYPRVRLLQALLIAYQVMLEDVRQRLAQGMKPTSQQVMVRELGALQNDVVLFDANYYFSNPVKSSSILLRPIWASLMYAQSVDSTYAESFQKTNNLSQFLNNSWHQGQQKKAEKQAARTNMWGIVLTFVGLGIAFADVIVGKL